MSTVRKIRFGGGPVAVTVVVAVLAAGCSDSSGSSAGGTTDDTASGSATAAGPEASGPEASGTSGTAGVGTPLPVLAEGPSTVNGIPLRISLNRVRVTGQLMVVDLTAANTSDPADRTKWQVGDFFSDGLDDAKGALALTESSSADGIYVLDPVNAKRYLVGRGPDQLCACSQDLVGTFVTGGESVPITATFKAPPPEVTSVTVVVPDTPAFVGVPVER